MSDLYTSLVRLKQSLNGDVPPMTPLTEAAAAVLDPAFTPGMGAIEEDAERGLRCPVRGCGDYFTNLGTHLSSAHRDIGGAREVKRLLDIQRNARLMVGVVREHLRTKAKARHRQDPALRARMRASVEARRTHRPITVPARGSMGERNFRNRCLAQLQAQIVAVAEKIGRVPMITDVEEALGQGLARDAIRVFGTWNAALAAAKLADRKKGCKISQDDILETLRAWYAVHGDLPLLSNVWDEDKTPFLFSRHVYLKQFDTESWPEAMRKAASVLGIYGGKYGLSKAAELYRAEKAKRMPLQGAA